MERIITTIVTMMSLGSISIIDCGETPSFSGVYDRDSQRITLCRNDTEFMTQVLFHELGHHMRYTHMTDEEKNQWYDLGVGYITPYASTHALEDFSEVFRFVVSDEWRSLIRTSENENIMRKYEFVKKLLKKYGELESPLQK